MSLLTDPAQAGPLNRYCAWSLLVLSVLTLIWSVFQLGAAIALDTGDVRGWLAGHNLVARGLPGWLLAHGVGLSTLQLLSCLPCVAIAVDMLRGRGWARRSFIALLLVTAVINLASVPLMDRLLLDLVQMLLVQDAGLDMERTLHELRDVRIMLWVSSLVPLAALSALHVWLAQRYCKADMRAVYRAALAPAGHGRHIG